MKSLSEAITRGLGRQSLMIQKNSPTLLFAGGIVGMVGSTVLACRATLKLEEVLEKGQSDLRVAKSLADSKPEEYPENEHQRDTAIIYLRSGASVAKLYAPSVILGAASVAMLTKSHNMLTERNAALTAAYVALDQGFKEYRHRVIEKYGEEQDRNFLYDAQEVEIKEEGKKPKKELRAGSHFVSPYARFFDECSTSWSPDKEHNRLFISCQQNFANDLLHSRGHLFLNEVYTMLGLDHTRSGAVVGWIVGGEGDGYVDFGVFLPDSGDRIRDFVNCREGSVLLDFNVDGVIYDQLGDPGEGKSWQLGR